MSLYLKKIIDKKNTLKFFMTVNITSHVQACFKSHWSGIVVPNIFLCKMERTGVLTETVLM